MTLAFHMDSDTAVTAYELFQSCHADTEEQRIRIIKLMIEHGYQISVFSTNRTPEQIVEDQAKHGSVLYVKDNGVPELKGEDHGQKGIQGEDTQFCNYCGGYYKNCSCYYDDTSST